MILGSTSARILTLNELYQNQAKEKDAMIRILVNGWMKLA